MSKRLQKLRDKWDDTRLLGLKGIPNDITPDSVFDVVVSADPTPNHKYVDWCLNAWNRGAFQWEDIRIGKESRVADQLLRFETNKHKVSDPSMRSLLKYKGPGELDAVMDAAGVSRTMSEFDLSSNQQKKAMMLKARLESFFHRTETGIKFEVPYTLFASQILGRNTRWCTAADNDNMFDEYAGSGPLIIITLPTGERYQLHADIDGVIDVQILMEEIDEDTFTKKNIEAAFTVEGIEIRDENDTVVSADNNEKLKPYIKEISTFIAQSYMRRFEGEVDEEYYEKMAGKTCINILRDEIGKQIMGNEEEPSRYRGYQQPSQDVSHYFDFNEKTGRNIINQDAIDDFPENAGVFAYLLSSKSKLIEVPDALMDDYICNIMGLSNSLSVKNNYSSYSTLRIDIMNKTSFTRSQQHKIYEALDKMYKAASENEALSRLDTKYHLGHILGLINKDDLKELGRKYIGDKPGPYYNVFSYIQKVYYALSLLESKSINEFLDEVNPSREKMHWIIESSIEDLRDFIEAGNLPLFKGVKLNKSMQEDIRSWYLSPGMETYILKDEESNYILDDFDGNMGSAKRLLALSHANEIMGFLFDKKGQQELKSYSLELAFHNGEISAFALSKLLSESIILKNEDVKDLPLEQKDVLECMGVLNKKYGNEYIYPERHIVENAINIQENKSSLDIGKCLRSISFGLASPSDLEDLQNGIITKDMISRARGRIEETLQKLRSPLLKSSIEKIDNYDCCGDITERLEQVEDANIHAMNILNKIRSNLLKGAYKNKPPEI